MIRVTRLGFNNRNSDNQTSDGHISTVITKH